MPFSDLLSALRTAGYRGQRASERHPVVGAAVCVEALEERCLLSAGPVGFQDSQISRMGPEVDPLFDAAYPAVAYNTRANEYLVVWHGSATRGEGDWFSGDSGELEIFAQRINAATGELIGEAIRISDMGPDGDRDLDAFSPAVVYNPLTNEYLVVWSGEDGVDTDVEIYGQRLSADGTEIGANDFRISETGPEGARYWFAGGPDVAYNSAANEYFVVWTSYEDGSAVRGQRLDAQGNEVGADDFQISHLARWIGPYGLSVRSASVVYNSAEDEYLVTWEGDYQTMFMDGLSHEVYGQRLSGDGTEIGGDFQISDGGGSRPDVVYNSVQNDYLVVYADWNGSTDASEWAIRGQRLNADGSKIGVIGFRISNSDPEGRRAFMTDPLVTYNAAANEYLVVWSRINTPDPRNGSIYLQRVSAFGSDLGTEERWGSDTAPQERWARWADGLLAQPAVTYNSENNEYLVVWCAADSDLGDEIFGRRLAGPPLPAAPPSSDESDSADVSGDEDTDAALLLWTLSSTAGDTDPADDDLLANTVGTLLAAADDETAGETARPDAAAADAGLESPAPETDRTSDDPLDALFASDALLGPLLAY